MAPILPDGDPVRSRAPVQEPRPPLRIQVLSDIHFEDGPCPQPILADSADVVVVAGDTCSGAEKAFAYLRAAVPLPTPIVTVMGNAAFHGRALISEVRNARRLAPDYGIHLLEDSMAVVGGVRFVGGTMWAGYDLHGPERQIEAMGAAMAGIADHRRILLVDAPSPEPFTPRHALALFQASTAYIATQLGSPWKGSTVVVTHHAPSVLSLGAARRQEPLAPAYASRLGAMVACGGAALWVHGHVHAPCDYRFGGTRVVCNPRGRGTGHPRFDPALVVEVAR